jgi:HTH-type transcriptional regulator/antitoxin HigA
MKTTTRKPQERLIPKDAAVLQPFPLRTERDYDQAIRQVEPLAAKSVRTKEEEDFLDIMTVLIGNYEETHYSIETSRLTGRELLLHLLKENGLTGGDLGRILGTRTQGYPILRGERDLSRRNMERLGQHFGLPPSVFFGGEGKRSRKPNSSLQSRKEIRSPQTHND